MFQSAIKTAFLVLLIALGTAARADEALWIDVRTAEEYAVGHVSEAINIPYDQIAARIPEVTDDRDALIYLYCRSGRRSGIAKDSLDRLGYRNVVNIGGLSQAQQKAEQMFAVPQR